MLKEISNHKGYFINESGIVIDKNNKILRQTANNQGDLYVTIDNEIEYISYLVAENFLINENNYEYVVHRDSDLMNNHLSNLYWYDKNIDNIKLIAREHRKYSSSDYIYQVYNEDESDVIDCIGRYNVAELIQYEEISLKNMIGNGRVIALGPYKGYRIRNTKKHYYKKED